MTDLHVQETKRLFRCLSEARTDPPTIQRGFRIVIYKLLPLERFNNECRPYPQWENHAEAFCPVIVWRACGMISSQASTVRALAERRCSLILDQAFSIGLQSGE